MTTWSVVSRLCAAVLFACFLPATNGWGQADPPEVWERRKKEIEQRENEMKREREWREALAAAHRKLQPPDRAIMFLAAEAAYRGAPESYKLSDQSEWIVTIDPRPAAAGCSLIHTQFASHVAAFLTWKFCKVDLNTVGYIGRVAAARAATTLQPQHITLPTGEKGVLKFTGFVDRSPFCIQVSLVDDRAGPVRLPNDSICLQ